MLKTALQYAAAGFAVLPLHSTDGPRCTCHLGDRCKSPGKHPRTDDGVHAATRDFEVIREWWRRWPDAWIGIATGLPSDVWVLDVDTKGPDDGMTGDEAHRFWLDKHGPYPAAVVETGSGGLHLYFRMPADGRAVGNRQGLRVDGDGSPKSGIDVRGTGGYVVAPPSGHKSGGVYHWVGGGLEVLCEAPGWLLDIVAPPAPEPMDYTAPDVRSLGADGVPSQAPSRERRYAMRAFELILQDIAGAPEKQRHDTLNRKAYKAGGLAHLLGGIEGMVQPLVDAFCAACGDRKREKEGRRTVLDALAKGQERPFEVPAARTSTTDRPHDPTWREPIDLPDEDEDIPVDDSWHAGGGVGGSPSDNGSRNYPAGESQETTTASPDNHDDDTTDGDGLEPGLLPTIRVNRRQMRHVLADAWVAIGRRPPSVGLYQQDGRLVRVLQSESGPRVEPVESGWLRSALVSSARWVKLRKATAKDDTGPGQLWVEVDCDRLPGYVVPSMVGMPREDLPILERVERAPYVDPTGAVVDREGYRADTRTYLGPHAPCPRMDHQEAVDLLRYWLADFPFDRAHDWAHALGFLVTPVVRSMVAGPCPIHVFEAPERGTGKTLLMKCLARVAAGYPVACSALAANDEERRKALVAHLLAGSSVVLLDNVKGRVDDDTLAGILTAYPRYSDRRMGGQSLIWAPARSVWALSGNNIQMSTDIARRSVVVRLDAKRERPENRQNFRIRDIEAWTDRNADRLRGAVLSLVEHWVALGSPPGTRRLGSYEQWSRVVGGIVSEVADGWLEGREERLRRANPEREQWRQLVRQWAAGGGRPMKAKDLAAMCVANELLLDVIGDKSGLSQSKRIAKALEAKRGVILVVDGEQAQIRLDGRRREWQLIGGPRKAVGVAPPDIFST